MVEVTQAAIDWIAGDDTGVSSEAIWSHMTGGRINRSWGGFHPRDPDDLGRCLRLLEIVPAWNLRIVEMRQYGTEWNALIGRWHELSQSMADEVGIDWSKGRNAPKTYALMREVIESANTGLVAAGTGEGHG